MLGQEKLRVAYQEILYISTETTFILKFKRASMFSTVVGSDIDFHENIVKAYNLTIQANIRK